MWEHALGIKLCQCLPVGVCYLPLCLVLCFGYAVGGFVFVHGIKMKINSKLYHELQTKINFALGQAVTFQRQSTL